MSIRVINIYQTSGKCFSSILIGYSKVSKAVTKELMMVSRRRRETPCQACPVDLVTKDRSLTNI